jgi:serine/threonine protein kinase
MDRYVVLKRVGDGTYGEVILATNKQTGEKVRLPRSLLSPHPQQALPSIRFRSGARGVLVLLPRAAVGPLARATTLGTRWPGRPPAL